MHEERHNLEIERDQLREMCQGLGEEISQRENEIEKLKSLTEENNRLRQEAAEVPALREEFERVSAELRTSQQVQQLMQDSVSYSDGPLFD